MTPNDHIKFKNMAQERTLVILSHNPTQKRFDTDYYVEGHAARYEPYELFRDANGEPVYERFERGCFDNCDMSDVIYQYDHAGRVYARTSNGSLIVEPDDSGLFMAGALSRTAPARAHYEDDIKSGMVTKMSWRFALGDYYYDKETRTIVHKTVRKIYDVSSVSIPANNDTEINARSWADGVIDQATRSEVALEERRRKLRTKINITLGGI